MCLVYGVIMRACGYQVHGEGRKVGVHKEREKEATIEGPTHKIKDRQPKNQNINEGNIILACCSFISKTGEGHNKCCYNLWPNPFVLFH